MSETAQDPFLLILPPESDAEKTERIAALLRRQNEIDRPKRRVRIFEPRPAAEPQRSTKGARLRIERKLKTLGRACY